MKKFNEDKLIKYLRSLIYRVLISCLIFLIIAIFTKKNQEFKNDIKESVFSDSISFTKINNMYNKYLGGIFPIKKNKVEPVFNEKLEYTDASTYLDGVNLKVKKNYLVPSLGDGMVVFIGEKEKYGLTIIVEGLNGVDIWYSKLKNTNVKLYDYIELGTYLGEINEDELVLVFQKDGTSIDYKEYIQ